MRMIKKAEKISGNFLLMIAVAVLFFSVFNTSVVYASYDTYLLRGDVSWDAGSKSLNVDWSPADTGGSRCEGSGVWSCRDGGGCQCVDEGQEQRLTPYVEVQWSGGALYDTYYNTAMHWDTDNERFTTPIYGAYNLDLSSLPAGDFQARFCLEMYNITDPGESKTQCGPFTPFVTCTPNCGDTGARCYYETWGDGCGGTCTGTKPADCGNTSYYCSDVTYSGQCATCTGTTASNFQCITSGSQAWGGMMHDYSGCHLSNGSTKSDVYNSACKDDAPTASIVSIDCGRIRVRASDPDRSGPVTIRLQYRAPNGGYYTYTTTSVSDYTFTFDQDALARSRGWGTYTWDVDVRNIYPDGSSGSYSYNVSSGTYTIYNPADYTDRCDRVYNIYINGDDKTSQLQGDISTGVLTWRSRVKELMLDYDGSLDVEVMADYNSWSVANNRCNTPSENPTQTTVFEEHLDIDCAVPRVIDISTIPDENPIELVSEVEELGQKKSVDLYAQVRCLYKSDELNEGYDKTFEVRTENIIEPDTGEWRFGDLDACSPGISVVTVNSEQYTLTAGDNATDCDDSIRAIIYQYILPDQGTSGESENWDRLEGTKNVFIDAGARVSEEFQYTGDVITNPPPGFDKFIQPYVSE